MTAASMTGFGVWWIRNRLDPSSTRSGGDRAASRMRRVTGLAVPVGLAVPSGLAMLSAVAVPAIVAMLALLSAPSGAASAPGKPGAGSTHPMMDGDVSFAAFDTALAWDGASIDAPPSKPPAPTATSTPAPAAPALEASSVSTDAAPVSGVTSDAMPLAQRVWILLALGLLAAVSLAAVGRRLDPPSDGWASSDEAVLVALRYPRRADELLPALLTRCEQGKLELRAGAVIDWPDGAQAPRVRRLLPGAPSAELQPVEPAVLEVAARRLGRGRSGLVLVGWGARLAVAALVRDHGLGAASMEAVVLGSRRADPAPGSA